jgi:hypothetical protein
VPDASYDSRTPVWGWLIIIVAIAMFVGLVLKALSTGGGR